MIITGFEIRQLTADAQAVRFSHLAIPKRSMYLLRVFTDEGIEGYGEVDAPTTGLPGTTAIMEEKFLPPLIGKDPLAIGEVWQETFNLITPMGRMQSSEIYVLAAIDIALWDIIGKASGQPLARLLGQVRGAIPAYASLGYLPENDLRAAIEGYMKDGYKAAKIRVGFDTREDINLVKAALETAGSELKIMVDVNSGWDPLEAVRLARRFDGLGLGWIEEPVAPYFLETSSVLAAELDTPVAIGEHEVFTLYDAAKVISMKAADILQPDLRAGGISECRRIAAYAAAYGIPCIPHFYGNGVRYAAMLHFVLSTQNCHWIETDVHKNPLRTEVFSPSLDPINGEVRLPDAPGLGIKLNMDRVDKYTVYQKSLGKQLS